MKLYRPDYLLSGFHAYQVSSEIPELIYVGEQWVSKKTPIVMRPEQYHWFFVQINGSTNWEVEGKKYCITPGGCLILHPDVLYRTIDGGENNHHFFFATLNMQLTLERLPQFKKLWQDSSVRFIKNAQSLLQPFRQLVREVSVELPHRDLGLRTALDYLLLEISRLAEKQLQARVDQPEASLVLVHPAVVQIKFLLETNPGYQWQLNELAQLSSLSTQHLVKLFTKEVGVSPHQYLMQLRIKLAQELLTQSDIPITELALELGFSSSQHFATVYKRLTGETAQRFRNSLRQ
jgi:AraC family transcriptional regulator